MPPPTSPLTPTPTILLLSLPTQILCAINLLSFTTSPNFHGIKNLPPGYHFIFTSETTSQSIRDGFWFHVPDTTPAPLLVRKWDAERGGLRPVKAEEEGGKWRQLQKELWERGLMPYRQTAGSATEAVEEVHHWPSLTRHVTARVLSHLTKNTEWRITTSSSALVDRDVIAGLEGIGEGVWAGRGGEEGEGELGVLGIDLRRTWREGAVGRERTVGRLDRTWALGEVVGRFHSDDGEGKEGDNGDGWNFLLGQMEVCFLMTVTIANWSCMEEWKRIVALVLTCKTAVREQEGWFAEFIRVLRRQVESGEGGEGGLFDLGDDEVGGFLRGLLRGFRRVVGDGEGEELKGEMEGLEEVVRERYGWELGEEAFLRRGMVRLEDGEMVEMEVGGLEEEDEEEERGEYAPVVVDLGDG